ncbi:MAG TPA: gamma-glutamylcyclotransferase family protein [Ramlibacter sp.]|jgi:hypothetical protein
MADTHHPAHLALSYGTLPDPDVLGAVLGRPVQTSRFGQARAKRIVVITYPGRVYPALVKSSNATALGTLIPKLSAEDLVVLDAFEGDEYRRELIEIVVGNAVTAAFAYLPVIDIRLQDLPWSLQDWTERHKPRVLTAELASARELRRRLTAREQS